MEPVQGWLRNAAGNRFWKIKILETETAIRPVWSAGCGGGVPMGSMVGGLRRESPRAKGRRRESSHGHKHPRPLDPRAWTYESVVEMKGMRCRLKAEKASQENYSRKCPNLGKETDTQVQENPKWTRPEKTPPWHVIVKTERLHIGKGTLKTARENYQATSKYSYPHQPESEAGYIASLSSQVIH